MKKRFPAAILALCLCLGLAAPAFAVDVPPEFSGSYTIDLNDPPFDLLDSGKNDVFYFGYEKPSPFLARELLMEYGSEKVTQDMGGWTSTTSVGYKTVSYDEPKPLFLHGIHLLPKGTQFTWKGLRSTYEIQLHIYTDSDNDGVYDQRLLLDAPQKGLVLAPSAEKYYSDTYSNFFYGYPRAADLSGDSIGILRSKASDGTLSFTIDSDRVCAAFGPNTIVTWTIVDANPDGSGVGLAFGDLWITGEEAAAAEPAPKFTDVPAWCADAVDWAVAQKVTEGRGGGLFAPADQCKNSEILTFLWRAAKKPTVEAKADIANTPEGCFYYDAAQWANDLGLIDPGTFDPNGLCTRAQAMTFICMAFGVPYDGDEAAKAAQRFSDVDASATYAYAVAWALENGITNGFGDEFRPDEVCSRGHIVTFLQRAYVEEARLTVEK